ncbi:MAG: tRNA pseudouridine(55) synthase TruB [Anaerolineales bacterium]
MAYSEPFGLLLLDKPVGPTSHDIVNQVRRLTGVRKVGHTGTLDPMASGLLVLCLGPATRLSEYLTQHDKGYWTVLRFGVGTDSHDATGEVLKEGGRIPKRRQLESALAHFRGSIEQRPPDYSAVKIAGKRAYELARAGRKPALASRTVRIERLELLSYDPPDLELHIECSAGTYIRSLARDLAESLGTEAHLTRLQRTRVGSFQLEQAQSLEELTEAVEAGDWEQFIIPAAEALPEIPSIVLDEVQMEHVQHGRRLPREFPDAGLARALTPEGELAAILEAGEENDHWQPRKVFLS